MELLIPASSLLQFFLVFQVTPKFRESLNRAGLLARNYRGATIVTGLGLVFVFSLLLQYFLIRLAGFAADLTWSLWLFFIFAGALAGLYDDFAGEEEAKGLIGHYRHLRKTGALTSGGVKALFGGTAALVVAFEATIDPMSGLVALGVLALTLNLFNLADVRPGRALKTFWGINALIFGLLIIWFPLPRETMLLVFPFAAATVGYAPWDFGEAGMLGDTGSGVLGAFTGLFAVFFLPLRVQVVFLVFLAVIHLVAEFRSFSTIIERHWLLRRLDRLGRRL